jgi:hypothetical protein
MYRERPADPRLTPSKRSQAAPCCGACWAGPATWSKEVEVFTPTTLRDLYLNLSKDDRDIFLRLIAAHCTGREPLMMLDELPRAELWKYNSMVFGTLIQTALPILLKNARELAKKNPSLSDEEFDRQLEAMVNDFVANERDVVSALVSEQNKEKRDAKPRNTDRDDEIVRLYDVEGKTFGEIPRMLILKNPLWCGKNGKPISRDAAEKAFHRRKNNPTN